jgi:hypothetical protein
MRSGFGNRRFDRRPYAPGRLTKLEKPVRSAVLRILKTSVLALAAVTASAQPEPARFRPEIPKTWDETALTNRATPLAGLNLPPEHISPEQ